MLLGRCQRGCGMFCYCLLPALRLLYVWWYSVACLFRLTALVLLGGDANALFETFPFLLASALLQSLALSAFVVPVRCCSLAFGAVCVGFGVQRSSLVICVLVGPLSSYRSLVAVQDRVLMCQSVAWCLSSVTVGCLVSVLVKDLSQLPQL